MKVTILIGISLFAMLSSATGGTLDQVCGQYTHILLVDFNHRSGKYEITDRLSGEDIPNLEISGMLSPSLFNKSDLIVFLDAQLGKDALGESVLVFNACKACSITPAKTFSIDEQRFTINDVRNIIEVSRHDQRSKNLDTSHKAKPH